MDIKISDEIKILAKRIEQEVSTIFLEIERVRELNFMKVLDAFRKSRVSEFNFGDTSGYGYSDSGREKIESVYRYIFHTDQALVRPQIISGTHAIAISLFGLLRPGDTLLYLSGEPYETGEGIVGIRGVEGSLKDFNVKFEQTDLRETVEREKIKRASVGVIQRSGGYSFKKSLTVEEIGEYIKTVKKINPGICVMIDNCYGEFVEEYEPTDFGADIIAGSLIKNIGGGITPTGGYIAGKEQYMKKVESRLTAPGLGKEIGPMLGLTRLFLQGVFFAPMVVSNALKGAIFASRLFELLGYEVKPRFDEARGDIVQGIRLNDPDNLIKFVQAVQNVSPIDWDAEIQPAPLAGYGNKILMAAGTFIQGSSIELSADAPMKPPYVAYLQGGIYYEHSKLASMYAAEVLKG
jgi:cystathionine beta-lyase family protein involved in aluminum resistance